MARQVARSARRALYGGLFVPPGHFYSPIVKVSAVRAWLGRTRPSWEQGESGIPIDRNEHLKLWERFVPWFGEMPFRAMPGEGLRYGFHNDAFGYGDGMVLYAMLRMLQPRRLIEVGSGHSSACSLDTIERFCARTVEVTFIEPFPALLHRVLKAADFSGVTVLSHPVQQTPVAVFEALQSGDILFIDSTHVLKTGSDVVYELTEVLPRLKAGVVVHFHDIFDGFEYPNDWIVRDNRSWNEIYALRTFLMYNDAFEILFFNSYFARSCANEIQRSFPLFLKNPGGSIWLRKRR